MCTNYVAPHYVILFMHLFTSSGLSQNILLSIMFAKTLNQCFVIKM
jgi:hypothetical protein